MSKRQTPVTGSSMRAALREWPLVASLLTTVLFLTFGQAWLEDLSNPAWYALMLVWPFVTILLSAFALVRHAESLAVTLGEPFGTLVLTTGRDGSRSDDDRRDHVQRPERILSCARHHLGGHHDRAQRARRPVSAARRPALP